MPLTKGIHTRTALKEAAKKANPYHDEEGRFTTKERNYSHGDSVRVVGGGRPGGMHGRGELGIVRQPARGFSLIDLLSGGSASYHNSDLRPVDVSPRVYNMIREAGRTGKRPKLPSLYKPTPVRKCEGIAAVLKDRKE